MPHLRADDAALLIFMMLVVWSFYRAQKDPANTFNLFDLITENGRVSKLATAFVSGIVVLSWIMIKLAIDGKMTEGYVGLYGSIVIGPVIAKLFSPPPPPMPASMLTATAASGTQPASVSVATPAPGGQP